MIIIEFFKSPLLLPPHIPLSLRVKTKLFRKSYLEDVGVLMKLFQLELGQSRQMATGNIYCD